MIVIVLSKRFARAMDAGLPAFRMVGVAAIGSFVAIIGAVSRVGR